MVAAGLTHRDRGRRAKGTPHDALILRTVGQCVNRLEGRIPISSKKSNLSSSRPQVHKSKSVWFRGGQEFVAAAGHSLSHASTCFSGFAAMKQWTAMMCWPHGSYSHSPNPMCEGRRSTGPICPSISLLFGQTRPSIAIHQKAPIYRLVSVKSVVSVNVYIAIGHTPESFTVPGRATSLSKFVQKLFYSN